MTSKKCLVVNLKTRGAQKPRGRKPCDAPALVSPPTLVSPQQLGNTLHVANTSAYAQNPYLFAQQFVSPLYSANTLSAQLTTSLATPMLALPSVENKVPNPTGTIFSHANTDMVSSSSERPLDDVQPSTKEAGEILDAQKEEDSNKERSKEEPQIEDKLSDTSQPSGDLTAVKKILEVVNATVSRQKEQESELLMRLRSGISPEVKLEKQPEKNQPAFKKEDKPDGLLSEGEDGEKPEKGNDHDYRCHFCSEVFVNRIDQHQHERYLCRLNKDVQLASIHSAIRRPIFSESDGNADSATTESEDGGSVGDIGDDIGGGEDSKNRMRSFINEEQLKILRAYYEINPRPRKFELIRIGQEIGFPKRVVQVWFQNMRARDRKKGRSIQVPGIGIASLQRPHLDQQITPRVKPAEITPKAVSPFTPAITPYSGALVPVSSETFQPLCYNTTIVSPQFAHQGSKSPANQQTFASPFSHSLTKAFNYLYTPPQETPLDLSLKPKPAHAIVRTEISSPEPNPELLSVLNLSRKADREANNLTPTSRSIENSFLYQYMHREGMIRTSTPGDAIQLSHQVSSPHSSCASVVGDSRASIHSHPSTPPPASISPTASSSCSDCIDENANPDLQDGSGRDMDSMDEEGPLGKRMRKKTWRQVKYPSYI